MDWWQSALTLLLGVPLLGLMVFSLAGIVGIPVAEFIVNPARKFINRSRHADAQGCQYDDFGRPLWRMDTEWTTWWFIREGGSDGPILWRVQTFPREVFLRREGEGHVFCKRSGKPLKRRDWPGDPAECARAIIKDLGRERLGRLGDRLGWREVI